MTYFNDHMLRSCGRTDLWSKWSRTAIEGLIRLFKPLVKGDYRVILLLYQGPEHPSIQHLITQIYSLFSAHSKCPISRPHRTATHNTTTHHTTTQRQCTFLQARSEWLNDTRIFPSSTPLALGHVIVHQRCISLSLEGCRSDQEVMWRKAKLLATLVEW